MSNYWARAVNPATGIIEKCRIIDNYFDDRESAVVFDDGGIYRFEDVDIIDQVTN